MRKGTLARVEIYVGAAIITVVIALAGYGLVSALADRLDPKVRACVARSQQTQPLSREDAVKLCKQLEAVGAL